MSVDGPRHIYLTPVRAEKADEFEEWVRSTLAPAEAQAHPERSGSSETLRGAEAHDGVVYFAHILTGGDANDWRIDDVLREALGDADADLAGEQWEEMVMGEQTGGTFSRIEM